MPVFQKSLGKALKFSFEDMRAKYKAKRCVENVALHCRLTE